MNIVNILARDEANIHHESIFNLIYKIIRKINQMDTIDIEKSIIDIANNFRNIEIKKTKNEIYMDIKYHLNIILTTLHDFDFEVQRI